jgi:hypothetical protein
MPTLHAVVETDSAITDAWVSVPAKPWPRFLRLHGGMTDSEVALLMGVRLGYGNLTDGVPSPAEIAAEGDSVLPGGLSAIDAANRIDPSCCCGIEGWREWLALLEKGQDVWMGHDPSPTAVVWEDGFRIFPDGGLGEPRPGLEHSIFFRPSELDRALRQVELDLRGALEALARWTRIHTAEEAAGIVAAFAATFDVQDDEPS